MRPPRALRAQPGPGRDAGVRLPPSASPLPGEGSAEPSPLLRSRCPRLPRLRIPGHYTEKEEQTGLTAAGLPALGDNPGCCRREGAAGKAQHGAAEMCLLAPPHTSSNYGAKGIADIFRTRRRQLPLEEGSAPGRHPPAPVPSSPILRPSSGAAAVADLGQSLAGRQRRHVRGAAGAAGGIPPSRRRRADSSLPSSFIYSSKPSLEMRHHLPKNASIAMAAAAALG